MARKIDLESQVRQLVEEKQKHVDSLSNINRILDHIQSLLNGSARVPPEGMPALPASPPKPATAPAAKGRRRRKQFNMTAAEFVLALVGRQKKPTTREINAQWTSDGRPFTADVILGKLVKEKKLKRTPLGGGERGSRYSLP